MKRREAVTSLLAAFAAAVACSGKSGSPSGVSFPGPGSEFFGQVGSAYDAHDAAKAVSGSRTNVPGFENYVFSEVRDRDTLKKAAERYGRNGFTLQSAQEAIAVGLRGGPFDRDVNTRTTALYFKVGREWVVAFDDSRERNAFLSRPLTESAIGAGYLVPLSDPYVQHALDQAEKTDSIREFPSGRFTKHVDGSSPGAFYIDIPRRRVGSNDILTAPALLDTQVETLAEHLDQVGHNAVTLQLPRHATLESESARASEPSVILAGARFDGVEDFLFHYPPTLSLTYDGHGYGRSRDTAWAPQQISL